MISNQVSSSAKVAGKDWLVLEKLWCNEYIML